MAGTTADELQNAIQSMATGMFKGNTADTLGAPVDLIATAITPITDRLGIDVSTPFGGSGHFRTMFGMDLDDKNMAETAGSMISIGGAAKAAIGVAKAAPAIVKTAALTGATTLGMMQTLSKVGNDVKQVAKESGLAIPKSQRGMIVAAERVNAGNAAKAADILKNHPEVKASSVYNLTGTYAGQDGGLRSVISDAAAKIKDPKKEQVGAQTIEPVEDVLDHPELFKLYPELKKLDVVTEKMPKGVSGSFNGQTGVIRMNSNMGQEQQRSVLLHELQHAVQKVEGWVKGGAPSSFLPTNVDKQAGALQSAVVKARESADPATREAAERYKDRFNAKIADAHVKYENIPGEQEARYTQETKDWSLEQLATNVSNMIRKGVTPQSWDTQPLPSSLPKEK